MEENEIDLQHRSETDIKLALAMQALYDGFCTNKGLQYLIDKARDLFGRPLILYDKSRKLLACSYDAEGVFDLVPADNDNRFVSENTIAWVRTRQVGESIRTNAVASASAGSSAQGSSFHGALCATIRINVIEVAELAVYENDVPFQDIDFRLSTKASALLSAQLQRNILLGLDHDQLPNYILVDLVEGRSIDDSVLQNKECYLKWARTENVYIIVLCGSQNEAFQKRRSIILQTLKSYIPIEQFIIYDASIVAFVDQILYDALFKASQSAFRRFLDENDLYAGISPGYSVLTESKKQYQKATTALEIGLKREEHCSFFEDCKLYIVSELVSSKYDLMDFCHPAIVTLMKYDKEHGTEYTRTLKHYLYYASAPAEAARILNIHRNTLFYRIGKIKELTGITLEYGDEICKLLLSLRMLEIHHIVTF